MLTVHHLNNSRSQRVLWLLEELGVPYEIKRYERDRKTMLAPPELRAVHPLGKSPVVVDEGLTIAESGAIIEYQHPRRGRAARALRLAATDSGVQRGGLHRRRSRRSGAGPAFAVNADGAETVARAAAATGAAVVHYSTDFVFDGELERPYDERDPPSPQGSYARSKIAGDTARGGSPSAPFHLARRLPLRPRWPQLPLDDRAPAAGRRDRARRPRLARLADLGARRGARLGDAGGHRALRPLPLHVAGETSWADFAGFAAAALGLPAERATGVPTSELPMKAPRPRRAILENRALKLRGLDSMPSWQDALRAFMAQAG